MNFPCPRCTVVATRACNLRKHLTGGARHGGHELGEADVALILGKLQGSSATAGIGAGEVSPVPPARPRHSSAKARRAPGSGEGARARRPSPAWQRELRRRQSQWREGRGYPIGEHNGRALGSRLAMPDAERELWNFLTPAIGELVRREYAANASRPRRERKVYGYPRLFDNLLSSQPLAFNLFGELKLNPALADVAVRRLWPARVERVTSIEFEWSPGRWVARYLDNGSAADVAIFHTTPAGGNGIIFVETKYHEDLRGKGYKLKPRYLEVARQSNVFAPKGLAALQRGYLQQIWLDHLLALATRDTDRLDTVLFVLLAPELNERCRSAVAAYRAALAPSSVSTFEARTLEEVVAVLDTCVEGSWLSAFRERYLAP